MRGQVRGLVGKDAYVQGEVKGSASGMFVEGY